VHQPELIRLSERQLNISIFFHYIKSSTVHELQCTLIIGLGKSMLVGEPIDGIVSNYPPAVGRVQEANRWNEWPSNLRMINVPGKSGSDSSKFRT
jgi:hypothetical protein